MSKSRPKILGEVPYLDPRTQPPLVPRKLYSSAIVENRNGPGHVDLFNYHVGDPIPGSHRVAATITDTNLDSTHPIHRIPITFQSVTVAIPLTVPERFDKDGITRRADAWASRWILQIGTQERILYETPVTELTHHDVPGVTLYRERTEIAIRPDEKPAGRLVWSDPVESGTALLVRVTLGF